MCSSLTCQALSCVALSHAWLPLSSLSLMHSSRARAMPSLMDNTLSCVALSRAKSSLACQALSYMHSPLSCVVFSRAKPSLMDRKPSLMFGCLTTKPSLMDSTLSISRSELNHRKVGENHNFLPRFVETTASEIRSSFKLLMSYQKWVRGSSEVSHMSLPKFGKSCDVV